MTDSIRIMNFYPGIIGDVTGLHASYYAENWQLDVSFEIQVSQELACFMKDFQAQRDNIWAAFCENVFAGSVAIDGSNAFSDGARLRWFITNPKFHGLGIGHMLLDKAIDFCKTQNFPKLSLWTFKGLEAARHLYLSKGFKLTHEQWEEQWGQRVLEQRYDLSLLQKKVK